MTTLDTGQAAPFDDDAIDIEQLVARRRRRLPFVTALLALGVLLAAAFIGGVEVQKHEGGSGSAASSGTTAASAFARFRGGAGGRGSFFAGGAGGAGSAANTFGGAGTTGVVSLIKGSTLYVTDFTGNTVKVTTTPAVRVSKSTSSSVLAIHPGDTIVVRGTQGKSGAFAATAITLSSAGGNG